VKKANKQQAYDKAKVISICSLYVMSALIILAGAVFSVISWMEDIQFTVLSSQVHGSIFGIVTAFLGVRYFLSVNRLKAELYKSTAKFSWNNFRKSAAKQFI
jgi:hypothetical protein